MRALLLVVLVFVAGCDVFFPSSPDPCPKPPEEHPEAWVPIVTAQGDTIGYACGAK